MKPRDKRAAHTVVTVLCGLCFRVLPVCAEKPPEPWQSWFESEDYAAQQGSKAAFYSMPKTASGNRIVDNDWGRDRGDFLRYRVDIPHACARLFVTVRFARASAGPAQIDCMLGDRMARVAFPSTGGWGFSNDQWRYGEIRFAGVPAGEHLLELRSTTAGSNLNTDGFFLSDHSTDVPGRRVVLVDAGQRTRREGERQAQLAAAVGRLPPIAYVVQERLGNPNGMVRYHAWPGRVVRKWGCRIEIIDPAGPHHPPRVILDDPEGAIFDLNITRDGTTLLFSHRKRGDENWHIWAIGVDGQDLRKITQGPYTDFGPEELPGGRFVFCSTRIRSFNICAQTLSTALFTMNPDGSDKRQITVNTLNDYSPHVLPSGQILYTRWEYVDRDVKWRQSLWTVNPDGTRMQLFFGNTVRNPAVMWQARPVPGSDRVVATFAPHHGWPMGAIGTVTRRHGTETPEGVGYEWITREYPDIWDNASITEWAYRDPFPLTGKLCLVSYGGGLSKAPGKRFRICLLDAADVLATVHEDETLSCINPVPIMPRGKPPAVAHGPSSEDSGDGVFLVVDVYEGLGDAVEPGEVKYLRIMEQPAKFPVNESGPRAYEMTPVMGKRCYYRKRCLGVVPVHEDGSAHFRVPPLRELYFQALDGAGRAVQSMGSAVNLVSGERQSCIGCHEHRNGSPSAVRPSPMAARLAPVVPTPYDWGNDGDIAFPVVVQPVLDKHCVRCHGGTRPDGRLDLSGGRTRFFSVAYDRIWDLGHIWSVKLTSNDGQVIPPKKAWSFASGLTKYLDSQHYDVHLSREEKERVHLWLDSNGNYYGTHARTRPGTIGGRDCWVGPWFDERLVPLFAEHCAGCHGKLEKHRTLGNRKLGWINLSFPKNSLLLNAHLANSAGGMELVGKDPKKRPPVWGSHEVPAYRAMLEAISEGRDMLRENPRVDMPGAVPRPGRNDWGRYPGTAMEPGAGPHG